MKSAADVTRRRHFILYAQLCFICGKKYEGKGNFIFYAGKIMREKYGEKATFSPLFFADSPPLRRTPVQVISDLLKSRKMRPFTAIDSGCVTLPALRCARRSPLFCRSVKSFVLPPPPSCIFAPRELTPHENVILSPACSCGLKQTYSRRCSVAAVRRYF